MHLGAYEEEGADDGWWNLDSVREQGQEVDSVAPLDPGPLCSWLHRNLGPEPSIPLDDLGQLGVCDAGNACLVLLWDRSAASSRQYALMAVRDPWGDKVHALLLPCRFDDPDTATFSSYSTEDSRSLHFLGLDWIDRYEFVASLQLTGFRLGAAPRESQEEPQGEP